jgi:hypothetical protein
VGDRPSVWSERLPSPPEARRYAAEGDWCAPDAHRWRHEADRWARRVAAPATGAVHLLVWAALLPATGFDGVPPLRSGSPPALSDLVRLAARRGRVGRAYLAALILLAAPAYALAAVLQRPGRLLAAVPFAAAVAVLLLA